MFPPVPTPPGRARRVAAIGLLAVWPALPGLLQCLQGAPEPETGAVAALGRTFPLTAYVAGLVLLLAACGRLRRALVVLVPASLLALPEAFYVAAYGLPTGPHVYGIVADTHAAEVLSWAGPWWPAALAAAAALLAATLLAARTVWRADGRWQHRSRWWVLTAGALLALGGWVDHQPAPDPQAPLGSASFQAYWRDLGLEPRLEATFPWGLPWRLHRFHAELAALHSRHAAVDATAIEVRRTAGFDDTASREVHVLVIGESARADRWTLFGAGRPTTPRLSARNDLLVFRDAVSAADGTRESVPLMLTRRPPAHALETGAEPALPTVFGRAGYRSTWLTVQALVGEHDTPISAIAHEADEHRFLNAGEYRGRGAFDGVLLPELERLLAQSAPRQFIVLHTLGSHLNYAHRYPPAFARFQPALPAEENSDIWTLRQQVELTNAYDNSVLYTDWLLAEVIGQLERSGAVATLTYAADHGETLFDGQCRRAGHGFAAEANYRVPMLMWLSPAWLARHPEQAGRLRARQRAPVSTLALFPTLTGLAGFQVAAPSAYPDLAGPLPPPARREVLHFGDFDSGIRRMACDRPVVAARPSGSGGSTPGG